MEYELVAFARRALQGPPQPPRLSRLIHRAGVQDASGLICAGEQTNVYCLLEPGRDAGVLLGAARCEKQDQTGVLTISTHGLTLDEGRFVETAMQRSLPTDEPWQYTEQLLNLRRAAIFGGGHCGLALSRLLSRLGFHVTVADERAEAPTVVTNEFATVLEVVPDMSLAAERVPHPSLTFAIVMGVDLATDVRALTGALRQPFPFIGLMGSPAKISRILTTLRDAGFGQEDLDRVVAPVGLPIGSRTPEEIAVSVAAQLVQSRQP